MNRREMLKLTGAAAGLGWSSLLAPLKAIAADVKPIRIKNIENFAIQIPGNAHGGRGGRDEPHWRDSRNDRVRSPRSLLILATPGAGEDAAEVAAGEGVVAVAVPQPVRSGARDALVLLVALRFLAPSHSPRCEIF